MADETDETDTEAPEATQSVTVQSLREHFPEAGIEFVCSRGEDTAVVRRDQLVSVLTFLRDSFPNRFDRLSDLTAVDYLYMDEDVRFAVVYHLHSLASGDRIRIKVPVPESDPCVASISAIWPAADWLEREVYDLYGIEFDAHPDLRRILMPDDFESFPLRKDYPLHGKGERDNFVF